MGDQQEADKNSELLQEQETESTRPDSNEAEVEDSTGNTQENLDTDDSTSSSHEQEGGDTGEKRSRLERRVDKLVSKLKNQNDTKTDGVYSEIFGNEPLVRPEDYQNGLSEQELEQRLEQRRLQDREQIKRELAAETEYRQGVNEHIADIDNVKERLGDNKELDQLVAAQYEALNYMVDPRTGQSVFVPRVKMSEIYSKLEKFIDKSNTQAAADVSGKLANLSSEQAVPSSVSSTSSPNLEEQAAFEQARSTGRAEDWAEVLKRRLKK